MKWTAEKIRDWRDETFGKNDSEFQILCRAAQEMGELLRAFSAGAPAEEVAAKAANVVIVLTGLQIFADYDMFKALVWDSFPGQETGFTAAAKFLADLVHEYQTFGDITPTRARIRATLQNLANAVGRTGIDLRDAIDKKMDFNLTRTWVPAADGTNRHARIGA